MAVAVGAMGGAFIHLEPQFCMGRYADTDCRRIDGPRFLVAAVAPVMLVGEAGFPPYFPLWQDVCSRSASWTVGRILKSIFGIHKYREQGRQENA